MTPFSSFGPDFTFGGWCRAELTTRHCWAPLSPGLSSAGLWPHVTETGYGIPCSVLRGASSSAPGTIGDRWGENHTQPQGCWRDRLGVSTVSDFKGQECLEVVISVLGRVSLSLGGKPFPAPGVHSGRMPVCSALGASPAASAQAKMPSSSGGRQGGGAWGDGVTQWKVSRFSQKSVSRVFKAPVCCHLTCHGRAVTLHPKPGVFCSDCHDVTVLQIKMVAPLPVRDSGALGTWAAGC